MKLKNLSTVRTGIVLQRKKASVIDENTLEYKTVSLKSFDSTITLVEDSFVNFNTMQEIKPEYLTQKGDVILRLREPNSVAYIDDEHTGLLVSSLMTIVRVKSTAVNHKYLAYFLNSKKVKRALESSLKGTTINMIQAKDLEELEVTLLPLKEQEKIVSLQDLHQKELHLLEELKTKKIKLNENMFEKLI